MGFWSRGRRAGGELQPRQLRSPARAGGGELWQRQRSAWLLPEYFFLPKEQKQGPCWVVEGPLSQASHTRVTEPVQRLQCRACVLVVDENKTSQLCCLRHQQLRNPHHGKLSCTGRQVPSSGYTPKPSLWTDIASQMIWEASLFQETSCLTLLTHLRNAFATKQQPCAKQPANQPPHMRYATMFCKDTQKQAGPTTRRKTPFLHGTHGDRARVKDWNQAEPPAKPCQRQYLCLLKDTRPCLAAHR